MCHVSHLGCLLNPYVDKIDGPMATSHQQGEGRIKTQTLPANPDHQSPRTNKIRQILWSVRKEGKRRTPLESRALSKVRKSKRGKEKEEKFPLEPRKELGKESFINTDEGYLERRWDNTNQVDTGFDIRTRR